MALAKLGTSFCSIRTGLGGQKVSGNEPVRHNRDADLSLKIIPINMDTLKPGVGPSTSDGLITRRIVHCGHACVDVVTSRSLVPGG